jgi:riboflavin synthase
LLIPHTLEVTLLGELRAGSRVNLEADMIAKQVARFVERIHAR